tara:strand:- start:500 stop:637 length:138 start_codon:yes stop_codon:yes gene_type:complete
MNEMDERPFLYHLGYNFFYTLVFIFKGFLYGIGLFLALKFCGVEL